MFDPVIESPELPEDVEVEIYGSPEMMKRAIRIKEDKLRACMAQQFDLERKEQKLRIDIKHLKNWTQERPN